MVSFHNIDHLRKNAFHNLNMEIMKIDNKVNFLKPYFLIERSTPPYTNVPYKYADCM